MLQPGIEIQPNWPFGRSTSVVGDLKKDHLDIQSTLGNGRFPVGHHVQTR